MFEQIHRLFAYAIVFLAGGVVAIVEIPVRAILFVVALLVYVVVALTAPLWVECDTEDIAGFVKTSLKFKLRWTKKIMRAYRDALI